MPDAPTPLQPGDKAPAFSLLDQHGDTLKLSSLKGRKVLVYFYPKADTPGCTTQSCALRDIAGDIGDTAIVGVSPDASAKQKKFDDKYSLGFPLLADTEHAVAEAFGVWGEKKNYGRTYMGIIRSAFLVDEKGKIEKAWYKISPKDTPVKLQQALAES
jgi:peroxiredoxin Q/BCP